MRVTAGCLSGAAMGLPVRHATQHCVGYGMGWGQRARAGCVDPWTRVDVHHPIHSPMGATRKDLIARGLRGVLRNGNDTTYDRVQVDVSATVPSNKIEREWVLQWNERATSRRAPVSAL